MVNTVAIYGASGSLGKATLASLLSSHQAGHIKLVILHRPSSDIKSLNLPSDVETRAIDLESDNDDNVTSLKAIKGLDVIV